MSRISSLIASAIVAGVVAFGIVYLYPARTPVATRDQAAFERVVSTKTIRCGYVVYPPGLMKDPNTKQISGLFADAISEAAASIGYKVEWTEEVGWGSMIEGLQTDRYDAICSPVWANSTRAQFADFTVPLFFSGIGVYTRPNDQRFVGNLAAANTETVTIATIDGEITDIIAQQQFPRAKRLSLTQLSDNSQILLSVAEGKADLTFVEPYIAAQFLKTNPGRVVNIAAARPIRIFANTMMIKKGETKLKSLLDTALTELLNSGRITALLRQYDEQGGTFYPVTFPYRQPTEN